MGHTVVLAIKALLVKALSIFIFRVQVRNSILECYFEHGEVRNRQSLLKCMYSKKFQYLHDKTIYTRRL